MVNYVCQTCDKTFKQKGHFEAHQKRKIPCKKNEELATRIISRLNIGLFQNRPYDELKAHYNNVLNKDKSTFKSSNDEPTPIECIEEMLSPIPDSFWKNENLKILDPCCGNGNFHFVIANKLRIAETDFENVLEFNDINAERLENVKKVFGNSAKTTKKDFLAEEFEDKYDLVVGNPPYALIMEDGKRASKNHNVSSLFIKKSLEVLKPNGYLAYIVPDNWMSLADRNVFCELLTQYQFLQLSIHDAKKWFPKVGSSFTWFVMQKTAFSSPFKVDYVYKKIRYTSEVESQVREYIPLCYSNLTQSIFAKTVDSKLPKYKIETSSDLHKYTKKTLINDTATDIFKHKLIHTPKQTVWASRAHKFQDGWKVFISTTDKYTTFVDECGMTQSIAFIRVDTEENAKKIAKHLMSPLYVFLNNVCRYGNFNNIRILQSFPVTSGDPYVEFGITDKEIEYIQNHL